MAQWSLCLLTWSIFPKKLLSLKGTEEHSPDICTLGARVSIHVLKLTL